MFGKLDGALEGAKLREGQVESKADQRFLNKSVKI